MMPLYLCVPLQDLLKAYEGTFVSLNRALLHILLKQANKLHI